MNDVWANRGWRAYLLAPVSLLLLCVVRVRATLFKLGWLRVNHFSVPVIVIGNISVGGTGKTPMVSVVVKRLQAAGYKPGIVSRGYGAEPAKQVRAVNADTPVGLAGDEPLLLARDTGAPICIAINRSNAVQFLIDHNNVDVVVSDDGMQHYAMHRDIELAVVDGQRKLGNGWLVPAGPLREPPTRLRTTNLIAVQQTKNVTDAEKHSVIESLNLPVVNAPYTGHFHLDIQAVQNVQDGNRINLCDLKGKKIHAMAGLGNPQRFFGSLRAARLQVDEHAMPDHHQYSIADLAFNDQHPILVTSKDAVKIRELDTDLSRVFEVMVVATLDADLDQALDSMIDSLK